MDDLQGKGMSLIVKTVTRITLGFILLYGIYIGLSGHASPGGGFAGGVIVALSLVHVMLAFGKETAVKRFRRDIFRALVCVGGLVFLGITLIGFNSDRVPAALIEFSSEVVLPLCEIAIVGMGLFAIFIALVVISKSDKDTE